MTFHTVWAIKILSFLKSKMSDSIILNIKKIVNEFADIANSDLLLIS